jgi:carbonic anhydrase
MTLPLRLVEGYRAFRAERLILEQSRYRELAEAGQKPDVMVIGCCDSRVSPEVIFDARPGELFVVRNVATLVPPYSPDSGRHGVSAALEYGVNVVGARPNERRVPARVILSAAVPAERSESRGP